MTRLCCTLFCASVLVAGCSPTPAPVEKPPADVPTSPPETKTAPVEPEIEAPPETKTTPVEPEIEAPPGDDPPPAEPEPTPQESPEAVPASPPPTESPDPAPVPVPEDDPAPLVVDIGGLVEVEATRPGLVRIGSKKCKICHKVQFASWAETEHAKRTPPLECENCHGAGSEYKSKAVMQDPVKARAAGMVIPERSFCAQCHTTGWSDDLLKQTHDHKDPGS